MFEIELKKMEDESTGVATMKGYKKWDPEYRSHLSCMIIIKLHFFY